ncbi:unnamed protein product [Nezara viridula]|uniref:Uncharacterized protein n=1 Tax=Nezara viridula TaxID=85310 RepID=A0A9P0HJZ5_NEZVI|nr:unnamed protein product [Nezara viridula]
MPLTSRPDASDPEDVMLRKHVTGRRNVQQMLLFLYLLQTKKVPEIKLMFTPFCSVADQLGHGAAVTSCSLGAPRLPTSSLLKEDEIYRRL